MIYKLGDKSQHGTNYLKNCMSFKKLQNEICAGDKFWKSYGNIISEFEFVKFYDCGWKDEHSNYMTCRICKGKIEGKYKGKIIKEICTGASQAGRQIDNDGIEIISNILKIIKKEYLPESLFEI